MSFRDPKFRQACLTWISELTNESVTDTADLVDARILIDITTQADPEYFASASLVLASRPGEPNLDGLAQLARLLLRYFEQGLGKQLERDCVPGVNTLATWPFDDLWRLIILVVSVTLLSERNGASDVYDGLDAMTQTELRRGVDAMWGAADGAMHVAVDLGASDISRVSVSENVRLVDHSDPPSHESRRDSAAESELQRRNNVPPQLMSTYTAASNDSFTSVQTSYRPFHSAQSSMSGAQTPTEQVLSMEQSRNQSGSHSNRQSSRQSDHRSSRQSDHHSSRQLHQQSLGQSLRSSVHEPALLPVLDAPASNYNSDGETVESIESSDEFIGDEERGSLIGFRRSAIQDSDERINGNDGDGLSDTDSYVSEFSQDLHEYGPDAVTIGFKGPNSIAAYLFALNTLAYFVLGVYLLLTTKVPPKKSPYFRDFSDMLHAIAQISIASVVSVALSVLWVQILRHQTRKVVWLTTLGVPVVSVAMAVWASVQVFSRVPVVEGLISYRVRSALVVLVSVIMAVRFFWSVARRRRDIEQSVGIISLACDVLLLNRGLYAFSILLLAFYACFVVISGIFASRLPLLRGLSLFSLEYWNFNTSWSMVAGYMALTFAWVSAMFVQLLRVIVSSVVCQWYFHRHDPGEPPALQTLQAATVSALTRQFGTVVLSASFLFIAKTLHLIELVLRWVISLVRIIPVSLVSLAIGRPIHFADGWSNYTVVYAAFTGKGFFDSSRAVTGLLQKHGLLHSPVVSLIRSSMTCFTLVLSLVLGYTLGLHAVGERSLHSALVAILGSIIPFSLLQLVTHILSCTVEALVVCHAIDMELGSCHSMDVAQVMDAGLG
ncbi:hypothetical protein GGI07_005079 [Coemansia sp. Benny D115]|nr:hypothetical protein GGI07_005079 [Coemansia sp. Benny D115]